ncbi:MAG: hypothetical protein ACYDAD_10690 [Acidimicrobiales bacterium]
MFHLGPRRLAAVAVLALLGAGCSGGDISGAKATVDNALAKNFGPRIASSVNTPGVDLFKEGVVPLMAEFMRILPDKTRVLSVTLNGGAAQTTHLGGSTVTASGAVVSIDVQQVADPALVDEYMWSHTLGFRGPKGTQAPGTTPIASRVFSLDAIDWSKLPQMGQTAVAAAGVPEGVPSTLVASKDLSPDGSAPVVQINVNSDRGSASVRFTPAGDLIAKVGS